MLASEGEKKAHKDLCVCDILWDAHWSLFLIFIRFLRKVYPIFPTWLCVGMLPFGRQTRHILPFGVLKWDKLLCYPWWIVYALDIVRDSFEIDGGSYWRLEHWLWLLSESLRGLSSTGTSALRYAVLESLRGFYQYLRGVMIIINYLSWIVIVNYSSFLFCMCDL